MGTPLYVEIISFHWHSYIRILWEIAISEIPNFKQCSDINTKFTNRSFYYRIFSVHYLLLFKVCFILDIYNHESGRFRKAKYIKLNKICQMWETLPRLWRQAGVKTVSYSFIPRPEFRLASKSAVENNRLISISLAWKLKEENEGDNAGRIIISCGVRYFQVWY